MSAQRAEHTDVILNREHALCDFADSIPGALTDRYAQAHRVRSASYFDSTIAGSVLQSVTLAVAAHESKEPLSPVECLIIASLYRDVHDIAASVGDGPTSDSAYVAEQDWRRTALLRTRRIKNMVGWFPLSFWRMTSLYGTSPRRFAIAVATTTLMFALAYSPAIGQLDGLPHLELRDDAFPNGYPSLLQGFGHAVYFSVIVLTTLGLGDIKPINLFARAIVGVEALLGVSLFGVLVTLAMRRLPNRVSRTWSPPEGKKG